MQTIARTLVFPSVGWQTAAGRRWRLDVEGAVYFPGQVTLRNRFLLRILRRIMKVGAAEFETELFRERIEPFICRGAKGLQVVVRLCERSYSLRKKTRGNGRLQAHIELPDSIVERYQERDLQGRSWLSFALEFPELPESYVEGRFLLVPGEGQSVVSDIDDTIKVTNVASRSDMLANTFLRPFHAIDGMAGCYQELANQNVLFHYVSSSPWQLLKPLDQLLTDYHFPEGSIHLRTYRLRDQMLRRLMLQRHNKVTVIRRLLHHFPNRQFVLIGDSGERDPEIYARVASKASRQVKGLLIRQLESREMSLDRIAKLQERVPGLKIQTFHSSDQLLPLYHAMVDL